MKLHFIRAGWQTSVQDLGRQGAMHMGISRSGAMDRLSHKLANHLVGNSINTPTLEMTFGGPIIHFEQSAQIAIYGAEFSPTINGIAVQQGRCLSVQGGDQLTLSQCKQGARAYLAVRGSWQVPYHYDSVATQVSANFGGKLVRDGDHLTVNTTTSKKVRSTRLLTPHFHGDYLLRICPSVETEYFTPVQQQQWCQTEHKVTSNIDRMGLRLTTENLQLQHRHQIPSTGLTIGSIQVPPNGQGIISGPDGQTTGGYPRIANIIHTDLRLLGQLRPNDKLRFAWVSPEELQKINKKRQQLENSMLPK